MNGMGTELSDWSVVIGLVVLEIGRLLFFPIRDWLDSRYGCSCEEEEEDWYE